MSEQNNMSHGSRPTKKQLRRQIIKTARTMSRLGLSPGRSGNVSARWKDGMLITPSGLAYDELSPRDIVFVDGQGQLARKETKKAQRIASSEWRFHLAAYQVRPDAQAVVHCHSMHATVLACAHKSIPAFHYMVAAAGGKHIPLVPYATFGTEALSRLVRAGLRARRACLMANHGQIACGETLRGALELAQEVEALAAQYYKVLLLDGVHLLDDKEMARVVQKFQSYGQKAQD